MLASENTAGLDPRRLDAASGDRGIGTSEVDVLEQAALRVGLGESLGAQALLVD